MFQKLRSRRGVGREPCPYEVEGEIGHTMACIDEWAIIKSESHIAIDIAVVDSIRSVG